MKRQNLCRTISCLVPECFQTDERHESQESHFHAELKTVLSSTHIEDTAGTELNMSALPFAFPRSAKSLHLKCFMKRAGKKNLHLQLQFFTKWEKRANEDFVKVPIH